MSGRRRVEAHFICNLAVRLNCTCEVIIKNVLRLDRAEDEDGLEGVCGVSASRSPGSDALEEPRSEALARRSPSLSIFALRVLAGQRLRDRARAHLEVLQRKLGSRAQVFGARACWRVIGSACVKKS